MPARALVFLIVMLAACAIGLFKLAWLSATVAKVFFFVFVLILILVVLTGTMHRHTSGTVTRRRP